MSRPPDAEPAPSQPSVEAWLARLAALLPPPGALDDIGPAERAVLLDLARIAAHRSHRIAAPMSTYLVGVALAPLPRPERLMRMRELVDRLAVEDG